MNGKIQNLYREAIESANTSDTAEIIAVFSEQLLAAHTKFMQEKMLAWMARQVYSGSSHRTFDMGFEKSPDWICWDELQQYFGPQVEVFSKNFLKKS